MLVALLAEKADIQYDSEVTDPEQLVNEVRSIGFGANLLSDGEGYQQGKLELTVSASCRGNNVMHALNSLPLCPFLVKTSGYMYTVHVLEWTCAYVQNATPI